MSIVFRAGTGGLHPAEEFTWAQPGTAAERRIHAAADPLD
jgi:hypothetical protein